MFPNRAGDQHEKEEADEQERGDVPGRDVALVAEVQHRAQSIAPVVVVELNHDLGQEAEPIENDEEESQSPVRSPQGDRRPHDAVVQVLGKPRGVVPGQVGPIIEQYHLTLAAVSFVDKG